MPFLSTISTSSMSSRGDITRGNIAAISIAQPRPTPNLSHARCRDVRISDRMGTSVIRSLLDEMRTRASCDGKRELSRGSLAPEAQDIGHDIISFLGL